MADPAREKIREESLQEALADFETSAATPFVSGEMVGWLAAFEAALQRLDPLLHEQIEVEHAEQFEEIGRQDPELLQHVENLRAEDLGILEQTRGLWQQLEVLRPVVSRIEPDEKVVEDPMATFSQAALDLVSRIRKQEVAIRTWLVEAYMRDRGIVD